MKTLEERITELELANAELTKTVKINHYLFNQLCNILKYEKIQDSEYLRSLELDTEVSAEHLIKDVIAKHFYNR